MVTSRQQLLARWEPKVAQQLMIRGVKVQAQARRYLGGATHHPRRVNTGNLRSSVQVRLYSARSRQSVRVGTNVRYGPFVHDGTGIYGPRRRPIRPRRSKFLVFTASGSIKIFARSVRGMPRNQFLKDALRAARLH